MGVKTSVDQPLVALDVSLDLREHLFLLLKLTLELPLLFVVLLKLIHSLVFKDVQVRVRLQMVVRWLHLESRVLLRYDLESMLVINEVLLVCDELL